MVLILVAFEFELKKGQVYNTLRRLLFGAESRSGPYIENQCLEKISFFKHGKLMYPCKLQKCICGRSC